MFSLNSVRNKKVLLHEGKRHTARSVVSARYTVLSPDGGGTPFSPGWGVPHTVLDQGVPHPRSGQGGTPSQV